MNVSQALLALYLLVGCGFVARTLPDLPDLVRRVSEMSTPLTRPQRVLALPVGFLSLIIALGLMWPVFLAGRIALRRPRNMRWLQSVFANAGARSEVVLYRLGGPARRLCEKCFLEENPSARSIAALPALTRERTRCHACGARSDCVAVASCA